jgi:hypothetical protein
VMFTDIFVMLFSLSGKRNGPVHKKTNCRQWGLPLKCGSPQSHDTWTFAARWPSSYCIHCAPPTNFLGILWECSRYDEECQTFNFDGALCSRGDNHCNMSNVVTFLHSVGTD